jgi:hypothetical protein
MDRGIAPAKPRLRGLVGELVTLKNHDHDLDGSRIVTTARPLPGQTSRPITHVCPDRKHYPSGEPCRAIPFAGHRLGIPSTRRGGVLGRKLRHSF